MHLNRWVAISFIGKQCMHLSKIKIRFFLMTTSSLTLISLPSALSHYVKLFLRYVKVSLKFFVIIFEFFVAVNFQIFHSRWIFF
jgi:hypothetical protein